MEWILSLYVTEKILAKQSTCRYHISLKENPLPVVVNFTSRAILKSIKLYERLC